MVSLPSVVSESTSAVVMAVGLGSVVLCRRVPVTLRSAIDRRFHRSSLRPRLPVWVFPHLRPRRVASASACLPVSGLPSQRAFRLRCRAGLARHRAHRTRARGGRGRAGAVQRFGVCLPPRRASSGGHVDPTARLDLPCRRRSAALQLRHTRRYVHTLLPIWRMNRLNGRLAGLNRTLHGFSELYSSCSPLV